MPIFSSAYWSPLTQLLTSTVKWHQSLAVYFSRNYGLNYLTSYWLLTSIVCGYSFISYHYNDILDSVFMDQYLQNDIPIFSSAYWSPLSQFLTSTVKWHQSLAFYIFRNYGLKYLTSNPLLPSIVFGYLYYTIMLIPLTLSKWINTSRVSPIPIVALPIGHLSISCWLAT